ncbi:hypothetical protein [Vibrio natriegens]|uniref:phage tail tip protein J-related protein n=1 Tax=Vibrio natriegens TaxID=691 RepID=UPI000357F21C|nr:hypothetical protein [Vibrio natriegens]ALR15275.1 hypothetical protein PN96_04510 [Vibrio natriegens NBRC 15636 = ATCC 14048 = DSM 759]EPM40485.1 hypothetical protein M272_12665 [Vibrio natriegens NBRC 15636 = ATCC 14048 = DSM 759]MDX6027270.1 hypothetical protein [Vibrio natriegens NBRC 15636 = ATCC 14048 = DSM 759]UUI10596.1 hypothetical protein NP431_08885 [Vibrio natriegens]
MWEIIAVIISVATAVWSVTQKPSVPRQERGGVSVQRFGIDQPLHVLYGKRALKPVIVYQAVKNVHTADVPNETYFAILVWGIGPVTSIENLKFDDQEYTKFGGFGSKQLIEHQLGSKVQTMPQWFADEAPDDMSGMHFNNLAVTYVKLAMDDEYKRYPQGRPVFTATLTARSDNPVEAAQDYFTNADYGLGRPVSEWDDVFNAEMAQYCNTVVDGQKLMQCNIALDTNEPLLDNFKELLKTCRGYPVEGQNGLRIEIDRQRTPVLHVSEDHLTGGMSTASLDIGQRFNQVTIRYPDRELNWETNEVVYPEKDSALHQQWLAEDNFVPLQKDEEVEGIDNYEQAMQYAEVLARLSRDSMTLNLPVKSFIGEQVEEMDVITVASQTRGWDAKPFCVREIDYKDNETRLKLIEYQDSHYLWQPKPPKPDVPDTNLPNPLEVAPPSGLSFSLSSQPNIYGVLSWQSPAGYITGYDVRIFAGADLLWSRNTKSTSIELPYLLTGQYQIQVRALGALAVSGWVVLAVNFSAPETPFDVVVDVGNTYVILRPQSNSLAFGTEYEFWYQGELRGKGVAWQMEGLQPETEYTFQVRAVNAVGESDFIDVVATTTKDASTIIDILDGKITQDILDDNLKQFLDQVEQVGQNNSSAIEEVKQDLSGVTEGLSDVSREAKSANEELFHLTSQVHSFRDEYERRAMEGETLVDAVVYRDAETGLIINRAFAYTEAKYTEAGIAIDGVKAEVAITAKEVERVETEAGQRLTEAEAAILVNAGQIQLKASHSEVNEIVAGALESITPAYSWQFNTSAEGWIGATWTSNSTVTGTTLTRSDISFNADDNSVIRLRVKSAQSGTLSWNGGSQNIIILQPADSSVFETVILKLTPADGWTGDITALSIAMDAEFDSIEIGKPSAAELQLGDVTYRVTQVEQELDPENARWSVFVTQDYWDSNALKLTDVKQEIDGWDAQWKVTATLSQLSENDTLEKANAASQWINASEANITQIVVAYNQQPGGVEDQLGEQADRLDTAEQQIDAQAGQISQVVTSLYDVENTLGNSGSLDELLNAYNDFLKEGEFELGQVALSYAEQNISAHSDELASQAQRTLELLAIKDQQQAAINRVEKVSASNTAAIAETKESLEAQITDGDETTLAQANTYTKAAVGYCVDANGNITNHDDAVLCVQTGNSWVDGPLANFIRNLAVQTADGQSASVKQLSQAFVQPDGTPVAKGGLVTDVNGRVSGMYNTNDGQQSQLDFIADQVRLGALENGAFLPLMYLDNTGRQMVVYGRMILGDGYQVGSVDDIRAQDGADGYTPVKGVDYFDGAKGDKGDKGNTGATGGHGAGMYTLTLRNGVFPTNATATADFVAAYGRNPVLDDHLTYRNSAGSASSTKRFNGTGWVAPSLTVHGDLLTLGSVTGNRFKANTEISAPIVRGGTGDFSGDVRAKAGSYAEQIEIGSAGGYKVFLKSVANSGHNVLSVENSSGDVMFALQGNGNLYSIGGGFLNNLTIGEDCEVLGPLKANQIIGNISSSKTVQHVERSITGGAWTTIQSFSVKASTSGLARTLKIDPVLFDISATGLEYGDGWINVIWQVKSGETVLATSNEYIRASTQSGTENRSFTVPSTSVDLGLAAGDISLQIRVEDVQNGSLSMPQQTISASLIITGDEFME